VHLGVEHPESMKQIVIPLPFSTTCAALPWETRNDLRPTLSQRSIFSVRPGSTEKCRFRRRDLPQLSKTGAGNTSSLSLKKNSKREAASKLHPSHGAKGAKDMACGVRAGIYRSDGVTQVGAIEGVQHHPLKLESESF